MWHSVARRLFPRFAIQVNFERKPKSTSRSTNDWTQGGSHMKRASRFVAIAFLAFVGCSTLHAQSNPLVGTWELNTAKSKYDPGPIPKSLTRTVEAQGDGEKKPCPGAPAA